MSAKRRYFLRTKLGLIFLCLAVLTLLVSAVVLNSLVEVRTDSDRTQEEIREMRHNYELLHALDSIVPAAGQSDARILELLVEADQAIEAMEHAPDQDPSELAHQAKEDRIELQLELLVDELTRLFEQGVARPTPDHVERMLAQARELARELGQETQDATTAAAKDLGRRIDALLRTIPASAGLTIVVLVFGLWLVNQTLVRPVRELREGVRIVGRGELDHRVDVAGSDEIGELATEFNQMADQLSATHQNLEELVRQRTLEFLHAARLAGVGTMAAGIAHEVNTPLATIVSNAEGLERRLRAGEVDSETQLEYLATIVRESYRAHEITVRMLDLARKEPGPMTSIDLASHVNDVVRLLEHASRHAGVEIEVEIEAGLPELQANGTEFDQAILNVLKNAVEVSPSGSVVRLRGYAREEMLAIDVLDAGDGIAEEHRAQLFDPFFTTKDPGKGTGLGLSLSLRIVERHGGRIELHDSPDGAGGALFRILFPLAMSSRERSA